MRVPDVVLKCVGFVGEVMHVDSDGISGDLHATGLFVSVPCLLPPLREMRSCYFVTAKHVAQDLEDRTVYFLVNRKGGGVKVARIAIGAKQWWLHPTDRTADVAAIRIVMEPDDDYLSIALNDFVTKEDIERKIFDIGDEVFTVGLFTPAPGNTRNMPIVRHGNLAMIPEEQLQTDLGYADVYLVEARSIGGLSGSPVFVRPTIPVANVRGPGGIEMPVFGVGTMKLLGLMQAHWDIEESEMNKAKIVHNRKRGVNLGIGIVVPAMKIIETLNHPQLVKLRRKEEEQILSASVPGNDSARAGQRQPTFTQKDFDAALKKVSRKIPTK